MCRDGRIYNADYHWAPMHPVHLLRWSKQTHEMGDANLQQFLRMHKRSFRVLVQVLCL